VTISGEIDVDTIVAQGCRPIGQPSFVTRCQRNVLFEIDGRPPLRVLEELYQTLGERDRELFRHSLFLGIVMNELQHEYRQGDFLIRNLIGIDQEAGAIAVGAMLHEGMVVQYHLRDARTSAEDLESLLARYEVTEPGGSLLFSCLGRGVHLYGRPDHDTDLFRRRLGEVPLGGFFCNGEIGPVQGRTFLHGYTSSFGIFRPRRRLLQ
jgi:small ligand-binding sensory domain FIST